MHRSMRYGLMMLMLLSAPGLAAGPESGSGSGSGSGHGRTTENTLRLKVQDIGANGAASVARHATGARAMAAGG